MISLQASRFLVSCEDDTTKVFINTGKEYKEVTNTLSDSDKDELISELIYAVSELVKTKGE